jgi:hypothetical protein
MTKAKLRKKIRRLKKKNLALIIECNAARVRAGEAAEDIQELREAEQVHTEWLVRRFGLDTVGSTLDG